MPWFDQPVGRSVLKDGILHVLIKTRRGRLKFASVPVSPRPGPGDKWKYVMFPETRQLEVIPALNKDGIRTGHVWLTEFVSCPKDKDGAQFHKELNQGIT